jgi:hypothetical protein
VVSEVGQTDPTISPDLAGDPTWLLDQHLLRLGGLGLVVSGDQFERFGHGEFESADRWDHADPLMRSDRVVFDHPAVDDRLGLLERFEASVGEELFLDRLVNRSTFPVVVGDQGAVNK